MKIGQVSFEFMAALFIVILLTTVFGVLMADKLLEKKEEQSRLKMLDLARTVKNEIDIANEMIPGYVRTFNLPEYLGNENYSVSIENDLVKVSIDHKEFFLAVRPINGTVKKGENIIRNDGNVFLNG